MSDYKYNEFGEQVKDAVDKAIYTGDFSGLGSSIGNIVNETIYAVTDTIKDGITQGQEAASRACRQAFDPSDQSAGQDSPSSGDDAGGSGYKYSKTGQYSGTSGGKGKAGQSSYTGWAGSSTSKKERSPYYDSRPGGQLGTLLQIAVGIILIIICLPFLFTALILSAGAAAIFFAALMAAGAAVAVLGFRKRKFNQRYNLYTSYIGTKLYIPTDELSIQTGQTQDRVISDLEKMIGRNMFRQAHLDTVNGCLILSDEAYRQYHEAREEYEKQKKAEEERRDTSKLSAECKKIIEDGENYIAHIKKCNDAIPGEELTAKLSKMEMLISRIFDEVRSHPEVAPDLRKMMDYYLPTTVKLLDAYCELDSQPMTGENISAAKKEIETTIDTLNTAYEKLFDDLFRDRAWDISSDISVLNTILAQEGLTDDGLRVKGENQ